MDKQLIWLHEKALGHSHPILQNINPKTKIVHVWDEMYYRQRSYSLKRLVFIYENLCELPVEIIMGNTIEVLRSYEPDNIIVPHTADTVIQGLCDELSGHVNLEFIEEKKFAPMTKGYKFTRFFKYWKEAKKTAFLVNGKDQAERK